MNRFKRVFKLLSVAVALVFALLLVNVTNASAAQSVKGFHISNGKLYDANNNEFIFRGINVAHNWYQAYDEASFKAVAAKGANTVRIVLSDGDDYTRDSIDKVRKLIALAEKYKLVAIVEVHDGTGHDEESRLVDAANYWIDVKDALKGHEDTVILNIANEWYGTWSSEGWANGYKKVIPMLRNAGIKNTLMVDCAGYGQYPKSVHEKGKEVFNADRDRNTIFSIHFYEYAGGTPDSVKSNLDGVINQGLPVCVGEFGYKHTNGDVAEETIINYCKQKGIGYLAWSWYGNGGGVEFLDLVSDVNGNNLTEWGNIFFNKLNGLGDAKTCSVYNGGHQNQGGQSQSQEQSPNQGQSQGQGQSQNQGQSQKTGLKLETSASSWYNGYTLNVTIKNTSSSSVNGWTLKVKKSEVNIQSIWGAKVSSEGDYFVITPENWTRNIQAGGSVSFGASCSGNFNGVNNYTLK